MHFPELRAALIGWWHETWPSWFAYASAHPGNAGDVGAALAHQVFSVAPYESPAWERVKAVAEATPGLREQLGHDVGSDLWLTRIDVKSLGEDFQSRSYRIFLDTGTLPAEPPQDVFNEIYGALDAFFGAATVRYEALAPILGLECHDSPIALGDNVSLIALQADDDHYFAIASVMLRIAFSQVSKGVGETELPEHLRYAFRYEFEMPKRIDIRHETKATRQYAHIEERRKQCLQAIAATTFTRALPWPTHVREIGFRARKRASIRFLHPHILVRIDHPQARIAVDDEPVLRRAWDHISKPTFRRQNRPIRAALNRLSGLGTRSEMEDQLVDAMIGAESFFAAGMKPTELTFRIAMNAASIAPRINLPAMTQDDVLSFMATAYNIRSRIVHGDDIRAEDLEFRGAGLDLNAWTYHVSEIVRRAIVWAFVEHEPGTQITIRWASYYFK